MKKEEMLRMAGTNPSLGGLLIVLFAGIIETFAVIYIVAIYVVITTTTLLAMSGIAVGAYYFLPYF